MNDVVAVQNLSQSLMNGPIVENKVWPTYRILCNVFLNKNNVVNSFYCTMYNFLVFLLTVRWRSHFSFVNPEHVTKMVTFEYEIHACVLSKLEIVCKSVNLGPLHT